jgi:HPt (histidine-containing phosphotransfer) domain-containing protein
LLATLERLLNHGIPKAPLAYEHQDQSPAAIFEVLKGFDVKKGLEQVNDMQELYRDVLVSFLDELNNLFADLPAVLAQTITDETRRKVHTLKGLAATVGATRLSRMARVINSALKCNHVITEELIEGLREALSEAKAELQAFVRRAQTRH